MPLTTRQPLSLFVVAILMFAANYAAAQAGSLDPSFGTNGIVATSLRATNAVALQSEGKIVLGGVGVFNNGLSDTLIRLNTNGSLDTSFGTGGVANFTPGNTAAANGFFAMAIQPNGEIVAAEVTTTEQGGYFNFVQVARVESNGSLDTSFGNGGFTTTTAIVFTPYDISGTRALALALQSNGSILVASAYSNLMARFTYNGQLGYNLWQRRTGKPGGSGAKHLLRADANCGASQRQDTGRLWRRYTNAAGTGRDHQPLQLERLTG
jgi:uncharacterized delta-60 repeat protein